MSFILRSHRDRYRQKARENLYRGIALACCFLAVLLIGYFAGQKKYTQAMRQLTQQTRDLQAEKSKAEQSSTDAQADLQTLTVKFTQLQDQYKRDVPQGDLALLTTLVKEQMDKGLAVERMAQIIRAAQPPQNCTPPVSKRVIAVTPNYSGPESIVTFADGLIAIKSSGEPSISNKQEKQAWFDPGKPVHVIFNVVGGKPEDKIGLLPLHHTIVLKDKEYRFTISEGPRSFIVIASDSCDYPEALIAPANNYNISPTDSSR